jgi:oligopeptide transport system substrate-binding protein
VRKILIIGCIILASVSAFSQENSVYPELRILNGAEPKTVDPQLITAAGDQRIQMALFESLFSYNAETGLAKPALAMDWTVSDDLIEYTFFLRRTTWSDGVPITAQTVVDSWLRMLDPSTVAPYAWYPSMFIKGAAEYNGGTGDESFVAITALDDYTLVVELVGPTPFFIDALPFFPFTIVPIHLIEEYGDEWINPEHFVSNGPFVLGEWDHGKSLTVIPNDRYWDGENVRLSKVTFLTVMDNDLAYYMYDIDKADWLAGGIPRSSLDTIEKRGDFSIHVYWGTYYYIFQTESESFSDPRIRQALSMAIDKGALTDSIASSGQLPASGFVPPLPGYEPIVGNGYDHLRAQELLAEAGYPNGYGFPAFSILHNTGTGHEKIARFIQQQWETILGIKCTIEALEWKTYLATRRSGDFDIARGGWLGDYPDPNTFLDMFVSGSTLNGGSYSNPRYDELIRKASETRDKEERYALFREAEEFLVTTDQAIIPLYYYTKMHLIDTDTWGGWYPNTMDVHPLKDIYLKEAQ